MQVVHIKQVDAFTRTPFTGNPAGVVLDAEHLDAKMMQKIALEMNLSETVYVLPATDEEADVQLRWFTPTQEVDLCGHATIAAFHALAEEGRFGLELDDPQSFVVQTRSGNLIVDVEWKDYRPYIKFSLPIPRFFPYPGDISQLCGALGLSDIELSQKVKPQIADNGYCFVPLKDFESMKSVDPNRALLAKLNDLYDLTGFSLVTTDTGNRDIDWHLRFFAPEMGVFEDPVTGSANGPMAAYLWLNGFLDSKSHIHVFKAEQGRFVGRTGFVTVLMKTSDQTIDEIQICGDAVTVLEGNLFLDEGRSKSF